MAKSKDMKAEVYLGEWLSDYLPNKRRLAEGSIDSYETTMQLYSRFLRETGGVRSEPALMSKGIFAARMSHFDATHVLAFMEWLRESRGNCTHTIEQRLAAIRSFLEYAAIRDLAYSSLFVQVKAIKIGGKDHGKLVGHMSVEAWQAVVAQPKLPKRTEWRNWVFMVLMYEIGGRNSEIIGLHANDLILNGDNPRVYVWGKGSKEGVTPIRESVAQILKDYVAAFHPGRGKTDDPLFYVRRKGEKHFMSPDCSEAFLKRYGEEARKTCPSVPERVHPHLVRHTRAQHLKDEGMSDEELAKFLRHSGTRTVKVYAQASAASKRKVLEKVNGKDPEDRVQRGSWEGDEEKIHRLRYPNGR